MHQNNCWLSVSLFYDKIDWNGLMGKGILPYIKKLSGEEKLKSYFIQLSDAFGENIRLPLLVPEEEADALAKTTDEYFKSYFLNDPSTEVKKRTGINSLFMNFAPNTIQYGLYSAEKLLSDVPCDPIFQQALSAIILEWLAPRNVSDETILMLSFFLYLSLLMIIWRGGGGNFDELMVIPFQLASENKRIVDIELVRQKFEENRYDLFEIACNVMKQSDKQFAWCSRWTKICEYKMQEIQNKGGTLRDGYRQIACLIDSHLGINESMKFAVFYFIRKVTSV